MQGIKLKANGSGVEGLVCPRCSNMNTPEEEHCVVCESPLTEQAKIEADSREKMKELVEAMIEKRFEEMKNKNLTESSTY